MKARPKVGKPVWSWRDLAINALLFQLIWFIAIFAQWYWLIVPFLFLLCHYVSTSQHKLADSFICFVVSLYGISVDSLMSWGGLLQYPNHPPLVLDNGIPLFLAILWVAFTMTVNRSLMWLVDKGMMFIPLCALVGTLSYLAARSALAVEFSNQTVTLIALEWLGVGLLCVGVNRFCDSRCYTTEVQQRDH